VTAFDQLPTRLLAVDEDCCTTGECHAVSTSAQQRSDPAWLNAAGRARRLAWVSLVWMAAEGALGLWQGIAVGSIALTGWALGSAVEGLASIVVVWRFSGTRTLSETAERRAQQGVAISFWLLGPYIALEAIHDLIAGHHAGTTAVGITLVAVSILAMPVLGHAKQRLATQLGSAATAGEGTQNYLCAAQAAAVLIGLAVTATWAGGWWVDPTIALAIAATAIWEGTDAWRGQDCC